jgi:hypothetical protein
MLDHKQKGNVGTLELKLEYLQEVLEPIMWKLWEEMKTVERSKEPLMTIEDVSIKFKVSKATIHNWKKAGLITGNKVGKNRYFTEKEVRNALIAYRYPQAG